MERRFARVWLGGVRIVALLDQELTEPMMGDERGIEQWAFSDRRQCLTLCHQIFDGREITVIDTRLHQTGPIHGATLRDVVDDEISPTLRNPIEHPRCVLCHHLAPPAKAYELPIWYASSISRGAAFDIEIWFQVLPARIGISSVVTQDQRRIGTADADRAFRRSPMSSMFTG
jgi:hypothetical protein